MEIFKYKKNINFMKLSKRFGFLSVILVILSLGLIFVKGFNYGIDFAGGTLIQIKYEGKAPISKIREVLEKDISFKGSSVNFFGSEEEIVIKTKISSKELGKDAGDKISESLKDTGKFEVRRIDMVGAKIGSELREKGIMATVLALIGTLIYVSVRFEWRFAVASIIALIHDVSITMGTLSLFEIEINLDILAAILTILGYSLNDTIIIFDRIREGLYGKLVQLNEVINESVTKTLSRTTLTSLTTFFVVLTLFLFGGEIINGFSLTLLIGIIVGTYSSIFVASPLLNILGFSVKDWKNKEAEKTKRQKEKEKMREMYEGGVM